VEEGHAEAVALARALIVDARWPEKARAGRVPNPVVDDTWRVINDGIDPGS
jgi:2,4-dienoyl-CoA reductase-like NADH-dependent reductase (Old Yellow Enzyme family)